MRILYISQYFNPEIGATSNRAYSNVKLLAQKGNIVTVLTEMPNHPRGEIFPEYKGRFFVKEYNNSIHILRIWVYTNPMKTFITRILFYNSFMIFGLLVVLLNWRKFDLIYVTSPPLFVGGIGLFIKKIFPKVKLVFEVRDLWPEVAIEIGELHNKTMIKLSESLARQIYKNSDKIIAVTRLYRNLINKKFKKSLNIELVRNGSDLEFSKREDISMCFKQKFNPTNAFLIVYAGNLGLAQNISFLLDVAKILEDENIAFLIIGTGPHEKQLLRKHAQLKLKNVLFIGEIPKSEVSKYFSIADCGVVPLRDVPIFQGTIPSKIFDYMSAKLPILLGVKGEAKSIVEESKAGICFEPENCDDFVEKAKWMRDNPNKLVAMANNGYDYVYRNYNRNKLAEKTYSILINLMNIK